MRRLFLLLVALRGCASLAIAADLPANDAGKNQLIIVGQPGEIPAKWFSEIPELIQTKEAVAFTLFTPTSALFNERYQATLGTNFPIVAYLRPDGGVVYFADRNTLPTSGEALFQEMKAATYFAKNAKPAMRVPEELDFSNVMQADCPDGTCYPDQSVDQDVRFDAQNRLFQVRKHGPNNCHVPMYVIGQLSDLL
ncbi:MAG TPA: hypothetical protein VM260_27615 [Pirellula sp.]|nr:hypothetical protein [Pirellula sp.]